MLPFLFFPIPFFKGDSHPELCAQHTDEVEGFFGTRMRTGPWWGCSLCLSFGYISLRDE
jgi:hypothetical protein